MKGSQHERKTPGLCDWRHDSWRVVLDVAVGAGGKKTAERCPCVDPTPDKASINPSKFCGEYGLHVCAFHIGKEDPKLQVEAHHYCTPLRDGVFQCVLYDSDRGTPSSSASNTSSARTSTRLCRRRRRSTGTRMSTKSSPDFYHARPAARLREEVAQGAAQVMGQGLAYLARSPGPICRWAPPC